MLKIARNYRESTGVSLKAPNSHMRDIAHCVGNSQSRNVNSKQNCRRGPRLVYKVEQELVTLLLSSDLLTCLSISTLLLSSPLHWCKWSRISTSMLASLYASTLVVKSNSYWTFPHDITFCVWLCARTVFILHLLLHADGGSGRMCTAMVLHHASRGIATNTSTSSGVQWGNFLRKTALEYVFVLLPRWGLNAWGTATRSMAAYQKTKNVHNYHYNNLLLFCHLLKKHRQIPCTCVVDVHRHTKGLLDPKSGLHAHSQHGKPR